MQTELQVPPPRVEMPMVVVRGEAEITSVDPAQRVLPTNTQTRLVVRPFLVNSCTPYLPVETLVEIGILPGMAEPERKVEPTQSSTPSVKSMLPERWNVQAECPKRRIVVED